MILMFPKSSAMASAQSFLRAIVRSVLSIATLCLLTTSPRGWADVNLPPVVKFLQPKPSQIFPVGGAVPVEVEAVDPDGYTHEAEFFLDGKSLAVMALDFLIPPAPGETQRYGYLISSLPAGPHVVAVGVKDNSGTVGMSEVRVLGGGIVLNETPVLELLEPAPGKTYVAGDTVAIVAKVTDPDGHVPHIEYFVDDVKIGEETVQFIQEPVPGETQSFKWPWVQATEGLHSVKVRVTDNAGATAEAKTLVIVAKDTTPPLIARVSIEATIPQTGEPCPVCRIGPGRITVKRIGDLTRPLTVYLGVSGTATPGVDYAELPAKIEIQAGSATAELTVAALDDALVEEDETVIVQLLMPRDGTLLYMVDLLNAVARVAIHSDDRPDESVPIVSIEATRPTTREPFLCVSDPCPLPPEVAPAVFTVRRVGGDLAAPLSVPVLLSGTAENGVDYAKVPAEILIPAGVKSVEFEVAAVGDDQVEGDETVEAMIPIPPGLPGVPPPYWVGQGQASIVIQDFTPDPTPVVSIKATQPTTSEPCPTCLVLPGVFTLSRSVVTDQPLAVRISYSGTATAGVDYDTVPGFVTIPAGKASQEIVVLAKMDGVVEGPESVVARVEPDPTDVFPPHYRVDPQASSAKLTIQDVQDVGLVPTVWVEVSRTDTSECPPGLACKIAPIDITFHRSSSLVKEPLTIFLGWGGTATFSMDYGLSELGTVPRTLLFAAGSDTAKLQLFAMNDCYVEGEESVTVEIAPDPTMGPLARYRVDTTRAAAKMVIHDGVLSADALGPVVSIRGSEKTLENCPPNADCTGLVFEISRKGGDLNQPLEVLLEYAGSATRGEDYLELPRSVLLPAGQSSVSFGAAVVDDKQAEGVETVVATLVCSDALGLGYVIHGQSASASVEILDDDSNTSQEAIVKITSPLDGEEVVQSAAVVLVAQAIDPKGAITRLTFFDGETKIGVSELIFVRPPDPGTVLRHEVRWARPALGEHTLTAVGTDSTGATVTSKSVKIRVVGASLVPVVSLLPILAETTEVPPGSKRAIIPATVALRRLGGPADRALRVAYKVGGSAVNGVDYGQLEGEATFAPGEREIILYISPISDELIEGDEIVELSLVPQDSYVIGVPRAARVVIHDAQEPAKSWVRWLEPENGTSVGAGKEIQLRVEASLSTGYFDQTRFFANGQEIGTDSLILCASLECIPEPGSVIPFQLIWKAPAAGTYKLTASSASAANPKEQTFSETILIQVTGDGVDSLAVRRLPSSYTPGAPVTVEIASRPPASAAGYAIVETPPKGWVVSRISDNGVFDAATSTVKFGPFLDALPRVLRYSVTPPEGTSGDAAFSGVISIDGTSSRIAGNQVIPDATSHHPADHQPFDWSLGVDEVTEYGAAWKNGKTWGAEAARIPLEFVTRAGALWRGGERYVYSSQSGAAPHCWINTSSDGVKPIEIDFSLPPQDLAKMLENLRDQQSFASADLVSSNSDLLCRVRLVPGKGVRAQAVEVVIPPGAQVTEITHEGVLDAATGVLRWGPFLDGVPRVLAAKFSGASRAGVAATASFDGLNVHANAALGSVEASGGSQNSPRIAEVRRLIDGSVQLFVVDDSAGGCQLMVSDDLVTWHELGKVTPGADCQVHRDIEAGQKAFRFYRAARIP